MTKQNPKRGRTPYANPQMKKGPRNLRLEQITRLEEIAQERACTVAEVIREAVDMLIESYDLADAKRTRV